MVARAPAHRREIAIEQAKRMLKKAAIECGAVISADG